MQLNSRARMQQRYITLVLRSLEFAAQQSSKAAACRMLVQNQLQTKRGAGQQV
jgi:hypothetical protein